MNTEFHPAQSRGHENHGWLDTYHTFSFAQYYNPNRMAFGVIRVLNDDVIQGGMGFGTHPHRNMEIISIALEGDIRHVDSMGNEGIISKGEVQVMSAGTGIFHSEKNANQNKEAKFLQIWVIPREENVAPRYGQLELSKHEKPNDFQQILSPHQEDEGVWIHQDAWFYIAKFDKGISKEYTLQKEGNGVYVFVIEGEAKVGEHILERRDGLGVTETQSFTLQALENAEVLLMEVPMQLPD